MAQRDITEAQAAVPEQDGFLGGFPASFQAGNNLAQFGVQGLGSEFASLNMGAQRAK